MRVRLPYLACLVGGMVIGFGLGHSVFPQLEAAFGDALTDILFGIVGVLFAAIAYEIVVIFWRPD